MIVTSIQINSNEELYTDLDIQIDSRYKKLSLLGIDPYSQVYKLDDIPKIFELSDRVVLHGTVISTGEYKFAFEDVISRLRKKDIPKLYVRTINRKLDWNIVTSEVSYDKIDIRRFKNINKFYTKNRDDMISKSLDFWYVAFLLAWCRLYKTKDKVNVWDSYRKIEIDKANTEIDWYKQDYLLHTRLNGNIVTEGDSSIINNYSLSDYRNPNYKLITLNIDHSLSSIFIMRLCELSNYSILPVKYIHSNTGGKLTVMCSKQKLNRLRELTSTYKSRYLDLHY